MSDQKNNYIKPRLNLSNNFILKNSRHPVVEQLLPMCEDFIPNDLKLSENKKVESVIFWSSARHQKSTCTFPKHSRFAFLPRMRHKY